MLSSQTLEEIPGISGYRQISTPVPSRLSRQGTSLSATERAEMLEIPDGKSTKEKLLYDFKNFLKMQALPCLGSVKKVSNSTCCQTCVVVFQLWKVDMLSWSWSVGGLRWGS